MRQSNAIDNNVNDVVMVVDHQQKRRLFLYNIHSRFFSYTVCTKATGWLQQVFLGCPQPVEESSMQTFLIPQNMA